MKMNACALIGQLINNILVEYEGNYEFWLTKMISIYYPDGPTTDSGSKQKHLHDATNHASAAFNALKIEILIDYLMRLIKFDNQKITNNMCKRSALK